MIIPTAEPFFFPGNKTGCLLVHGFTGTPKEMHWLGEFLQEQGYTVLGIRLPGHATCIEDMMRMHWQDWLAAVEDGYCLLKNCVDEIFIMGLSMGGMLSLLISSKYPISGVVAMSTMYELPNDPRLPFVKILSSVMKEIEKGPSDWHNPDAAKDHMEYPHFPVKGIIQLRELLAEMRNCLPKIKTPVLIIQSREDHSIEPASADKLLSTLGSVDKQVFWVENSGHVITREPDRFLVFAKIDEFIKRVIDNHSQI